MQLNELETHVVEWLEDMKAKDITVLDVSKLTDVTDRMIIASGTSSRHVRSIADNVVQESKNAGHPALGSEGEQNADWVLVDLGDIVVHVMMPETRALYDLEKLWTFVDRENRADLG